MKAAETATWLGCMAVGIACVAVAMTGACTFGGGGEDGPGNGGEDVAPDRTDAGSAPAFDASPDPPADAADPPVDADSPADATDPADLPDPPDPPVLPQQCAPDPACPAVAGLSCRCIVHDNVDRRFQLYVPALIGNAPAPLVFAVHGWTMSGDVMRELTAFTDLADDEGFVVAFPEGVGSSWSSGGATCGAGASIAGAEDDIGFLEEAIATIDATTTIDHERVFVTGFSMGGYFSNQIGCERPDLVRAIAPHSGGGPATGYGTPLPALIIHGSGDLLIDSACGLASRDAWVAHNGCSTDVDIVDVAGGHCEWHHDCPVGGQVTLCWFDGMGHGWAAHEFGFVGGGAQYQDATRLVWEFFRDAATP